MHYLWVEGGDARLKSITDGFAKFQPIKGFSLLLILDIDIPHGGVKTFMTGEVFNGGQPHSLLM